MISDEVTTISPVNGAGGHNIYPSLHVLFYEETEFVHGHYQSIRPSIQPPASTEVQNEYSNRPQIASVSDSIGEPQAQSTNVDFECEATCNMSNQNSTQNKTQKSREQSYLSESNIISKRTRQSKK